VISATPPHGSLSLAERELKAERDICAGLIAPDTLIGETTPIKEYL
jgi:hypothetical protein